MSVTTTAGSKTTLGRRTNGKLWHTDRQAFRPTAGLSTFSKRMEQRRIAAETKEIERNMKERKEEERQSHIQGIKDKRAAKEEKERFEKMAEKMHQKKVERLKRKEKRNKLLKS